MANEMNLFDAAIELRLELPDILGPGWEIVDRDLGHLLAQADAGQDIRREMVEMLMGQEDLRARMGSILGDDIGALGMGFRGPGFKPLPGHPVHAPGGTRLYCCPTTDCGYCWVRHKPSQPVPICPEHNTPLVET